MSLNKACRRWIASLLALALACAQLLTAAYACPAASEPASTTLIAGMPDCDSMSGLDQEQPQLCKAHCDRDRQTVNNAPAPDLAAPAAVLDRLFSRLALWPSPDAAEALPAVVTAHTGPPGGAPPVYLALQVLRH